MIAAKKKKKKEEKADVELHVHLQLEKMHGEALFDLEESVTGN